MMEILLKRQVAANIPAVVIAGTTGEGATLTDSEKVKLFRFSKEILGGHSLTIAGTGSNCTEHSIALSIAAEKAGADAVLIVSPYYNKTTPKGLIAHYTEISNAISIPIILYNVPSRTGVDIPVSVYKKLSELPNIAGVKEASTDITKITKILNTCSENFTVWSGNDEMIVPSIALGAKGVISVVSNLYPTETKAMVSAALDGDFDSASDLQRRLQPAIELLFCESNPIPVKAAMRCIGFDCGSCRLPLTPMRQENQKRLEQFFS
jgi:4-hydroxy-tetrahydrodipicolinate synthase